MTGATGDEVVGTLDALLASTPPPPGGDPDELLVAYELVATAREPLVARLEALAPVAAADPRIDDLRRSLVARDQEWIDAFVRAQRLVDERIGRLRRARRPT